MNFAQIVFDKFGTVVGVYHKYNLWTGIEKFLSEKEKKFTQKRYTRGGGSYNFMDNV